MIHITAGFGDNGFKGTWTLEICCVKPVKIYPNMKVGELCYFPVVGPENIKYQGKYLGQIDTTATALGHVAAVGAQQLTAAATAV